MKLVIDPIQRGAHVVYFALALIVFTFAQSGPTKVETQHGKSKTVQRFHRVEHNFVVQRSAKQRVRMANQCRMRGVLRAGVKQSFQASCLPLQKQRTDRQVRGHRSSLHNEKEKLRHREHRAEIHPFAMLFDMDAVTLTRQLVDIESITGNEAGVGNYLYGELCRLGYQTRKMAVEDDRFNLYATSPEQPHPAVVFSTHIDTVPPFIPSSEDAEKIYGRGSCDAKGIIAAQIAAAERLRREGVPIGLLFVVGEERDSLGAHVANQQAPSGCKFLVNGEPTENHLALASKGTLRVEVTAHGRMAHSAYPELGESAIEKLIPALARLRAMPLPSDPEVGPCTLNIGLIEGGRAPNIIPDYAHADLLYRLIGPTENLRKQILATAGNQVEVTFPLELPFLRLRTVDGLPTMIAAFTTDIPKLTNWGQPLLIGPGSIHVAHTEGEHIEKRQLHEAIDLYCRITKQLLS
jgi:acetylornithine deacetylase